MQIDDAISQSITSLRRVSSRAHNAVRFAYWSQLSANDLRCQATDVPQLREGCLRAALMEFSSIEDVQLQDYNEAELTNKPVKLNDTNHPLLHIFRELRNHEVHLRQSELRAISKDVLWGDVVRPQEATPLTISIWVLDGITVQSFSALKNARSYSKEQITKMLNWFNSSQENWGFQELLCLAIEEYCREIAMQLSSNSSL